MKTIEEKYSEEITKEWPGGEWSDEPDKKQWIDKATGFPCLIVRNFMGGLCGYVGVPPSHALFEKTYSEQDFPRLDVHGGVTFTDKCQEDRLICHTVETGEDDNVWWVGFDCGHCDDLIPGMMKYSSFQFFNGEYRNIEYVTEEVLRLAKQLKERE